MAVAWIGNREARLEEAAEAAVNLLAASRCPVISMETDVHGVRAALALADRTGAACDLANGGATLREAAQLADRGMMTVAPGEARRRADMLVFVGEMPKAHAGLIGELLASTPDLSGGKPRSIFSIGKGVGKPSVTLAATGGVAATLAGLRAQLAGRPVARPVRNFGVFAAALGEALFPVFVWSGLSGDAMALDMLQGLVADLNARKRASSLHLPASEDGWAAVLASGWTSGFPPRTGFARGTPEYDPWLFDGARMIADGEADLLLSVGSVAPFNTPTPYPSPQGGGGRQPLRIPSPLWGGVRGGGIGTETKGMPNNVQLIALTKTSKPIPAAAVTIPTGIPGIDHDAITYRARLGTLGVIPASAPSDLPSAASILRLMIERFDAEAPGAAA